MNMEVIRELYEAGCKAGIEFEDMIYRNGGFESKDECGGWDGDVYYFGTLAASIVRDKVREWLLANHGIQFEFDGKRWWRKGWLESYPTYEAAQLAALRHVD